MSVRILWKLVLHPACQQAAVPETLCRTSPLQDACRFFQHVELHPDLEALPCACVLGGG